jgi:hypothetical protein
MAFFFPEDSTSAKEREYIGELRQRTLLTLSGIIRGADAGVEIENIDKRLFKLFRPRNFAGRNGAEAQHVRRYEEICASVAQATGREPKQMTTREFFYTLQLLKQQSKRNGQSNQGKRPIPR